MVLAGQGGLFFEGNTFVEHEYEHRFAEHEYEYEILPEHLPIRYRCRCRNRLWCDVDNRVVPYK